MSGKRVEVPLKGLKFKVRWKDDNGEPHEKTYDTETDACRARDWILARGAPSADIAVVMKNQELKMNLENEND